MKREKCLAMGAALFALFLLCGDLGVAAEEIAGPPKIPPLEETFRATIPQNWDCFPPKSVGLLPGGPDERFVSFPGRHKISFKQEKDLMDMFAWRSFVAVNWPVAGGPSDTQWRPLEEFSDAYPPRWATWLQDSDIFTNDGVTQNVSQLTRSPHLPHIVAHEADKDNDGRRDPPVWDQNGKQVHYEVRVNETWADKVLSNGLDSITGQEQYQKRNRFFEFLHGQCRSYDYTGAIELRLAWKIMGDTDRKDQFYIREVTLPDGSVAQAGLVGMHINRKTVGHSHWIWATFEHVYNAPAKGQEQEQRAWSFYDPTCSSTQCLPNVEPKPDANGVRRTQITRLDDIDDATKMFNKQAQAWLRKKGSVWQYYALIGTQYEPRVSSAATARPWLGGLRSLGQGFFDLFHDNLKPKPPILRNTTMETYLVSEREPSNCMGCHDTARMAVGKKKSDFSFLLRKAQ